MTRAILQTAAALILGTFTLVAQSPGRWITDTYAPLPQPEEEYTAVVASARHGSTTCVRVPACVPASRP